MSLPLAVAVQTLQLAALAASRPRQRAGSDVETVSLEECAGRVAFQMYAAPYNTPRYDTSAMDGFAVRAEATWSATEQTPVRFEVLGTLVPGEAPPSTLPQPVDAAVQGGCFEIMTGARFPDGGTAAACHLDSTVPVELVAPMEVTSERANRCSRNGFKEPIRPGSIIQITRPVPKWAHRRLAGADMRQGDIIVEAGQRISSSHIMPLSAAGFEKVRVSSKPRVGILSTGREFAVRADDGGETAIDINGPYLTAAARERGADATFLGYLDDSIQDVRDSIQRLANSGEFDLLISTGGVSKGRFDLVRDALDSLGATVLFHGVHLRPGHPALLAVLPPPLSLPSSTATAKTCAFAGLPGNPGAAAACFQLLVAPYLRQIQLPHLLQLHMQDDTDRPTLARAAAECRDSPSQDVCKQSPCAASSSGDDAPSIIFAANKRKSCDYFIPGRLQGCGTEAVVVMQEKPSPAGVRPFISANCWVHVEPGQQVYQNSTVKCYRFT